MTQPDDPRTDEHIARLLVESLDNELGSRLHAPVDVEHPGPIRRAEPVARHRRWAPLAAAAAVVVAVLAVVLTVGVGPDQDRVTTGPLSGTVEVTCTAPGGDLGPALPTLEHRAIALAHGAKFYIVGNRQTSTFSIPGTTRSAAARLCATGELQLRPLIAPAVRHRAGYGNLNELTFAAPATEAGYTRLTSDQQTRLLRQLAITGCSEPDPSAVPIAACVSAAPGSAGLAVLLGAPIIGRDAVTDARAVPPSAGAGGSAEWTVQLTLTKSAGRAWTSFTARHNADNTSAAESPLRCGRIGDHAGSLPCTDYIGFSINGRIVSLPLTESAIGSTTQIAGSFNQASAEKLAVQLRADPLPVPVVTDSVRVVR